MKKLVIWAAALGLILALLLWITTKVSTAHKNARSAIERSAEIARTHGTVRSIILIGSSDKTGPTGKGCASLAYFVIGTRDSAIIQVMLTRSSYKADWVVVEVTQGREPGLGSQCTAG